MVKNKKEKEDVTKPLCEQIKNDELEELKSYIPVTEFGINVGIPLNIDIVAFDQDFGLNGNDNTVAIECKYGDDINDTIKNALSQAIYYQTSFKKVYIAVNKNRSDPEDYVKNILKKLGIGLITSSSEGVEIALPPEIDKLGIFSKNLYKKNTFDRAFIAAAFSRACGSEGYSKSNFAPHWVGSKKGASLHLWVEMPIKDEKLSLGCAYNLGLNENEYEKVEEAALRISILEDIKIDESVKKQIFDKFPNAGYEGKNRDHKQEWDYDFSNFIKNKDAAGIEKEMKERINWAKSYLKDKIS